MSKEKDVAPARKMRFIRLAKVLDDRLVRLAADRSVKSGRTVSVNALIVEAVEKAFGGAQAA